MTDFSASGPNFRGADLCFIEDIKTQESIIRYYLSNKYQNFLPRWKKLRIPEVDYVEKELPIFLEQVQLL